MLVQSLPLRVPCNGHHTRHRVAGAAFDQLPGQQRRHHSRLHAAGGVDSSSKDYGPDEIADYEDILRRKKAAKQQALQNLKQKRKFNPLHAKLKISPAEQQAAADEADEQQHPSVAPAAATNAAQGGSGSSSSSAGGSRFAARPRIIPGAMLQQQQLTAPAQSPAAAASAVAAAAAAGVEQVPAAVELLGEDTDDASLESGEYPSDSVLGKMLAELLEGEEDEEISNIMLNDTPEVEPVAVKAQRRKTPAQVKAAAIRQRALQQRMQRKRQAEALAQLAGSDDDPKEEETAEEQLIRAISSIQQQQPGSTAAAAEEAEEDEDDDLDWEALGQYEQLEQYLGKVKKERQMGPRRATLTPTPPPPAAAAKARAAKQPPPAQQPSIPIAAAAASNAAQSSKVPVGAAGVAGKRANRGSKATRMDKDLDELEELVSLLEAMETGAGSSAQAPQGLARKPLVPAASSSRTASAGAAAEDPGEKLLKALLGDDWEAELLDDLAAVIDDDEDGASPKQQQQGKLPAAAGVETQVQQSAAAAAAEDEEPPWADEVTALLLGLITISHEKYIKKQIPLHNLESIGEDERCAAFWQAPWALFMVEDSSDSCVEYVNQAAADMWDGSYLDLFGRPTHELVADDLTAQSDWAYAVQKVEESSQFSVQLPLLQLQDLHGRPVCARDVTMWRVDSLEDTPIGMAVLVRKWDKA